MDLILWRHAEAEDGLPDMKRELTDQGRKQAGRMADWLNPRLAQETQVLVSPARRALQTARALGRSHTEVAALAPGAGADAVVAAAGWPDAPYPVLIVGHQPTLGQVAAKLLSGQGGDLSIKKGAVWWFQCRERDGELQVVLRAVVGPDWL